MRKTPETAWRKSVTACLDNVTKAATDNDADAAEEWAKVARILFDGVLAVNVEGTQRAANSDGTEK